MSRWSCVCTGRGRQGLGGTDRKQSLADGGKSVSVEAERPRRAGWETPRPREWDQTVVPLRSGLRASPTQANSVHRDRGGRPQYKPILSPDPTPPATPSRVALLVLCAAGHGGESPRRQPAQAPGACTGYTGAQVSWARQGRADDARGRSRGRRLRHRGARSPSAQREKIESATTRRHNPTPPDPPSAACVTGTSRGLSSSADDASIQSEPCAG